MKECIERLEQRVADLEKKVAAGTTTDNSLLAKEVTRILLETGMNVEEANAIVQTKNESDLTFILACDEVSKEFSRDRQG